MKKTYFAPEAKHVAFETEEILEISYNGGTVLDKEDTDNNASFGFGEVDLF